jgi:phenylpropionate dioxygenase-like ring-hydroxylating dioxygenase large terminal subunit
MYGRVLNTITPESETTCMYFWSLMSNYKLREQSAYTQLREANAKVFAEDQAVVEAQHHALESYAARAMRNLNIDAGSMRARRIIEDMIEAEARNAAALGS